MCLIIQKPAGVTLDAAKFKTAVMNNPHGWGLSVPDGEGNLFTLRDVAGGDTDAEMLYEYIHDEFKDDKVLIHLRYTTAGETILRNAHPFPILERGADGVDLRMAHNGTLSSYEPKWNAPNSWESDTRVFTRQLVRPLMKRLILGRSSETVLADPFTNTILDNHLTAMSVLSFIDGNGNTLNVNADGNGGFTDDDGTWFSNSYSFDEDHRKPYKYTNRATGVGSSTVGKPQTTTTSGTKSTYTVTTTTGTDCDVKKFTAKYDIGMKDDLYLLSDEAIEMLVDDEPEDAVLLIKELLYDLYEADRKLDGATKALARKSKLIKDLETNKIKEANDDRQVA